MIYQEEDFLQLSGIQHYAYCPRQWALIHIEGQWEENAHTTMGEILHTHAHEEGSYELKGNLLIFRGLRVSSANLGVSGQCDVVEFSKDNLGITLHGFSGKWVPKPIEYKKGNGAHLEADEMQLVGQTLCLEEMLQTHIITADLFYFEKRRRESVVIDEEKRERAKQLIKEMHELMDRKYTPKIGESENCHSCSMKDICTPQVFNKTTVEQYIINNLR